MTTTTVRRLVPADAEAYRALMLEAYAQCPEAFTSSLAERERLPLPWWQTRLSPDAGAAERVFGAWNSGTLVGAAGLALEQRERTRHKATLFGMYVRAPARGHGIGRRLVDTVLRHARRTPGLELLQLTVSDSNAAAIALYGRCGFEPFGCEPMAVKLGAQHIAKLHMWRPTAPTGRL